ncbi:MAG TPA: AAA family ATPase [Chthoniobacterales bacterium]|nr:AAA family ATPase [Chthoniobacterales bacterium]
MNVLICSSTGAGKTFISALLARELKLPFLRLEYGGWIVTGARARGGLQTLSLLYSFLDRHEKGIIVLDELDKLATQDSAGEWTRAVHLEVFSVLDRRVLPGIVEGAQGNEDSPLFSLRPEDIQRRLERGYFIVGSGAWQHLWHPQRAAGFGLPSNRVDRPTYDQLLQTVPPEILNRFRADILYLGPLTKADYESLVKETLLRLPPEFGPFIREAAARSLEEAVRTQKGYRWIEELVASAIRILRISKSNKFSLEPAREWVDPS